LTLAPHAGFTSGFGVVVTVSDGSLTSTKSFLVSQSIVVANSPPVLQAIADQSVEAYPGTLTLMLSASDSDGDPLTFSAQALNQAYFVDQRLGLYFAGSYSQNYLGLNEKWMLSTGGNWYYIVPDGRLYRWGGADPLVATLDSTCWTDPARLHDAAPVAVPVTLTINGNQLTLTPHAGFTSGFGVVVTVSDGSLTSTKSFLVSQSVVVANNPPVLQAIADQSVGSYPGTLTLTLSASDPDGNSLTFSAEAVNQAYLLDQQLGLYFSGSYSQSYLGLNEKWLLSTGGNWYYIVPDGRLYRWGGSNPLVATLDSTYWTDPTLLYNAASSTVPVTLTINGNQLTLAPHAGFTSGFGVVVTVSDGSLTSTKSFLVSRGGAT
jgi:hypothetical protein